MMKDNLLIFGGRSTALEIYEVVKTCFNGVYEKVYLVIADDDEKDSDNQLHDNEVHSFSRQNRCAYILSFADHSLRLKIEREMYGYAISPVNVIHPNAVVSDSAKIGLGNYIAANSVISNNVEIGNHNIINFNVTVGHDSFVGDHAILNPGAIISANVVLGSRTLVGANSFIFQGKSIGDDTIIDAMTYIDRDIEKKMICSSKRLEVYRRVVY